MQRALVGLAADEAVALRRGHLVDQPRVREVHEVRRQQQHCVGVLFQKQRDGQAVFEAGLGHEHSNVPFRFGAILWGSRRRAAAAAASGGGSVVVGAGAGCEVKVRRGRAGKRDGGSSGQQGPGASGLSGARHGGGDNVEWR